MRILIVGYGSVGRRHVRNLQALGCEDFVFLRSHKGHQHGVEPPGVTVTRLDEALALEPNAAVIANPSALHLDVAIPLARAGCHLFIDKPLGSDADLDRCGELAELAQQRGLTTMVGCQFRFHPLLKRLRDELAGARLGEVLATRAEWGEYLPGWHPYEDHRDTYPARVELGGGALLTLIHPIDYLYWLFGKVRSTTGVCRKVASLETSVPDDWADLQLEFDSGVLGQVHVDFVQRPAVHQLHVWGDAGRALFDYHAGTLNWTMADGSVTTERVPDGFDRNDMFLEEMRDFLVAVDAKTESAIPIADGVATLRIVSEARQSCRRTS